jgi:hypothetical protein
MLIFLIAIAEELEELNNYHALMAFVASFSSLVVDKMELWKVCDLKFNLFALLTHSLLGTKLLQTKFDSKILCRPSKTFQFIGRY